MKITVLAENQSTGNLGHEHGLSLFIEYNNQQYLLDTGASDLYQQNAAMLGLDLSKVDAAILSHGHFDHSGGFGSFVEMNSTAPIYMRENAAGKIYAKEFFITQYIGIPKEVIMKAGSRFVYVSEDTEIAPGVFLIGHHTPDLAKRGKLMHMYYKNDSRLMADDFSHEQTLVFDTENGLVLFNSCSHGGVDLIIQEVQKIFPDKKIRAMIGGFHLMGLLGANSMRDSREEVAALGKRLMALQVEDIYTCHCTGLPAYKILKNVMKDQLHEIHGGNVLSF